MSIQCNVVLLLLHWTLKWLLYACCGNKTISYLNVFSSIIEYSFLYDCLFYTAKWQKHKWQRVETEKIKF